MGVVIVLFLFYQETYFESIGINTSYAFEIFDKFRETGKLQSNSFDVTSEMWKTLPSYIETWILGDAKYEDENGGYYMHTDVGYLRVIFYGGIVGLFFYLYYIYKLIKLSYLRSGRDENVKFLVILYYLLVLVWMWKGHYDTNCFLYLLLFAMTLNQMQRVKVKNNNEKTLFIYS